MEQPAEPGRRRRRRARRAAGPPAVAARPAEVPTAPQPTTPADEAAAPKPRRRKPARDGSGERGLRDIVGAGRSQVGVSGALRVRDLNRPTAEDIAEAERDIAVVRRNWTPPERP